MPERRFNEEEVAAIFQRATEAQQSSHAPAPVADGRAGTGGGLTLSELQEIGREVGIPPELVRHAATSIDQVGQPTARSYLGLPIGVGRTVELERRLTDEEWDRLVVDLRETFDARGSIRRDGSLLQWTNGNLQALLEPTATGQRLRLRTIKGDSRSLMTMGIGMMVIAAASYITAALRGQPGPELASLGMVGLIGIGSFVYGALRLPGWARLRASQMKGVADRVTRMIGSRDVEGER